MMWPIAVLFSLIVFGSVYWLKPSPRDTRLAALRLDAIKRRLQVRQFTFTPDSAKNGVRNAVTGVSYTLVSTDKPGASVLLWRVVGQAGWESDGLPEGLSWHDRGSAADAALLTSLLPALQDDILLLEVFSNRVTLMVAEHKTATAEGYEQFLTALLESVDA